MFINLLLFEAGSVVFRGLMRLVAHWFSISCLYSMSQRRCPLPTPEMPLRLSPQKLLKRSPCEESETKQQARRVAFVGGARARRGPPAAKGIGTQNRKRSRLNGGPLRTPVNASPRPSRATAEPPAPDLKGFLREARRHWPGARVSHNTSRWVSGEWAA
jgi:hypothetical protein